MAFKNIPKTTWLRDAKNLEELKTLYRKLAFEHHPDLGGSTSTMQEINAEYEYRRKSFEVKGHNAEDYFSQSYNHYNRNYQEQSGQRYGGGNNYRSNFYQDYAEPEKPSQEEKEEAFKTVKDYADKANPYFHVSQMSDGEVIAWGRTFKHKDFLRDNGFWWDPDRRVWHFVRKPFTPY